MDQQRVVLEPDEVRDRVEQVPVGERDLRGVAEREQPEDAEDQEERARCRGTARPSRRAGAEACGARAGAATTSPATSCSGYRARWAPRDRLRPGRGRRGCVHGPARLREGSQPDALATSFRNCFQAALRRLVVLLHSLDGVARGRLEVTLVRTQRLRLQLQRRVGEDLADRRVAEERIPEVLHRLALQQRQLARQVARLLEDVCLRGGEVRNLISAAAPSMRRLLGDGEERAAPVAAAARDVRRCSTCRSSSGAWPWM